MKFNLEKFLIKYFVIYSSWLSIKSRGNKFVVSITNPEYPRLPWLFPTRTLNNNKFVEEPEKSVPSLRTSNVCNFIEFWEEEWGRYF